MVKLDINFFHNELNRVIEMLKFAEQKSSFLSLYYTGLLGFIISNIDTIEKNLLSGNWLYIVILIITVFLFIIGYIFLVISIFPKLKNNNKNNSLFYFNHIFEMGLRRFEDELLKIHHNDAKKQIIEQIYTNSIITDSKMKSIKICSIILVFLIIFISMLFVF